MSEQKRLKLAWIFLAIAASTVLIEALVDVSSSVANLLGGVGLVFVLMALGYSTKLLSSMNITKKTRAQGTLIMLLTAALVVYAYLI